MFAIVISDLPSIYVKRHKVILQFLEHFIAAFSCADYSTHTYIDKSSTNVEYKVAQAWS